MLNPIEATTAILVQTFVEPPRVYHGHRASTLAEEVVSRRGSALGRWVPLAPVDGRYRCPDCDADEGPVIGE